MPAQPTSQPRSRESILQAIRKAGVEDIYKSLTKCAPSPLDGACLALACTGARVSLEAAFNLIPDLNSSGRDLLDAICQLESAVLSIYADRGEADALDTLKGRRTKYRSWATLAFLGDSHLPKDSSRLAACGIELALKWQKDDHKEMAHAHMAQLAKGSLDFDLKSDLLIKGIHFEYFGLEDVLPWFQRTKGQYHSFLTAFAENPPQLPPPPNVHERARARWIAKSAYPKFKARAGVFDQTTASALQLDVIAIPNFMGDFNTTIECRTVLWLEAFSGIPVDAMGEIPLSVPINGNWSILIELSSGLLKRDFAHLSLSKNISLAKPHCVPTSTVACVPIPIDILQWLRSQHCAFPNATIISDLAPHLLKIKSTEKIYESSQDMPLTWARLTRSIGRYMLQIGIDNLLAATITGDFGITATSKLHYCSISSVEIWNACRTINEKMGFAIPSTMPSDLLNFGTGLVQTKEYVSKCDTNNLEKLEKVRKMGKSKLKEMLDFHNQYVICVGYRLVCILALRQANPIDISTDINIKEEISIDIDDKSTIGRPGALPIPLADCVKNIISLYVAHCKALLERLKKQKGTRKAQKWLNNVVDGSDDYLLCLIDSGDLSVNPLKTSDIIEANDDLVKDFGRKIMENELRALNHFTRDIDRYLRHEVLGQESYTSISDDSERSWVKRMSPSVEIIFRGLFKKPVYGLRSTA